MNELYRYLNAKVQEIEKNAFQHQKWRAGYHLMPPTGWLNDPNGLCMYQGEYHIFFQYAPFDAEGGLKFWGHYKSKDMIHWDYLGVPLLPEQPFDLHGAYSGCALIEEEKMYLYYTGNVKLEGDFDYINTGRQSNTMLVESNDGIHFGVKQCLLTSKDYPDNLTLHVRDPKVWKKGDLYYMVLGARTKQNKGVVLCYTSEDKTNWHFQNTITSKSDLGYMWECPDFFEVNGQNVLSVSPQGMDAEGRNYQNKYQSGYFFVKGDITACTLSDFKEWDRGFDFYAPQTFCDEKGRRILIAWAGMPDEKEYHNPTVQHGWQHMLTMPREITCKNGKIYQIPLEEMKQLRGEKIEVKNNSKVSPCFELQYENESGKSFAIEIEKDLLIKFHKEQKYFEIRFQSDMGAGRKSRSVYLEQCDNISIFADESIMEIYINGGEEVFCTRFYPQNEKIMIYYDCDIEKCIMWGMNHYRIRRSTL